MALLIFSLFFLNAASRRTVIALIPFFLFGISYDWMNIVPNYKVNPVDVAGLYETEKALFGIATQNGIHHPQRVLRHSQLQDYGFPGRMFLSMLGTAANRLRPVPLLQPTHIGVYTFCNSIPARQSSRIRNILYPPRRTAMVRGSTRVRSYRRYSGRCCRTGKVRRYDRPRHIQCPIRPEIATFSLQFPHSHSAYTLIAFVYALLCRAPKGWTITLAIVTLGIWFTAVYSSHHYIIDVSARYSYRATWHCSVRVLAHALKALRSLYR